MVWLLNEGFLAVNQSLVILNLNFLIWWPVKQEVSNIITRHSDHS